MQDLIHRDSESFPCQVTVLDEDGSTLAGEGVVEYRPGALRIHMRFDWRGKVLSDTRDFRVVKLGAFTQGLLAWCWIPVGRPVPITPRNFEFLTDDLLLIKPPWPLDVEWRLAGDNASFKSMLNVVFQVEQTNIVRARESTGD